MVAHACNPSIWEAETGGSWFEDCLSYLGSLQLSETLFQIKNKKEEPGVVAHTCNPSIWEAETGRLRFTDSLSYLGSLQLSETLFQIKNF